MPWNKSRWLILLIVLLALGIYLFSLYRNVEESKALSLQLKDETAAQDHVLIRVTVISVNPAARQLRAQMGFRFLGNIAQDEVTPKVNLKLLVNNIAGGQEFDFPKGKRMYRIEATFPLDGDLNKYPLDRYDAQISFLMTTPRPKALPVKPEIVPKRSNSRVVQKTVEVSPDEAGLAVGETTLHDNIPVPLSISLSAAVPEVKFSASISRGGASDPTEIELNLNRTSRVMRISIVVMIMMMCLAISVLAMALKATTRQNKFDLLPLSLSLTLIFGLPALRSIQPGIPPVGVLGDNLSFTWAELLVAVSAVIIMWTWLIRSERR